MNAGAVGGPPPAAAPPVEPATSPSVRSLQGMLLGVLLALSASGFVMVREEQYHAATMIVIAVLAVAAAVGFMLCAFIFSRAEGFPWELSMWRPLCKSVRELLLKTRPRHFVYGISFVHYNTLAADYLDRIGEALASRIQENCLILSVVVLLISVCFFRFRPRMIASAFITSGFVLRLFLYIRKRLHVSLTLLTCLLGMGSDVFTWLGTWLATMPPSLPRPTPGGELQRFAEYALRVGRYSDALEILQAGNAGDPEVIRLKQLARELILKAQHDAEVLSLRYPEACIRRYSNALKKEYQDLSEK